MKQQQPPRWSLPPPTCSKGEDGRQGEARLSERSSISTARLVTVQQAGRPQAGERPQNTRLVSNGRSRSADRQTDRPDRFPRQEQLSLSGWPRGLHGSLASSHNHGKHQPWTATTACLPACHGDGRPPLPASHLSSCCSMEGVGETGGSSSNREASRWARAGSSGPRNDWKDSTLVGANRPQPTDRQAGRSGGVRCHPPTGRQPASQPASRDTPPECCHCCRMTCMEEGRVRGGVPPTHLCRSTTGEAVDEEEELLPANHNNNNKRKGREGRQTDRQG